MNLRVQRPGKDQTTYQALSPLRPMVMQRSSNTLYVLPLFM
ncbi:unnamed protein product [Brassica napus]|uniref:(rape) hypothetical protein n=1 Tax=Brassica napus TaxID=3708 RepID=A0A816RU52_BRANA|nr:unnamed protein product [Brassica napus]